MTPEMIADLSKTVHMKTVESTWLNILVKAIFCNFFINIGIYVSMLFKEGLARAFFICLQGLSCLYSWVMNTLSSNLWFIRRYGVL